MRKHTVLHRLYIIANHGACAECRKSDSLFDIYSFEEDFEKLYAKTAPKRLMCDLLKNNHLNEPTLSLV